MNKKLKTPTATVDKSTLPKLKVLLKEMQGLPLGDVDASATTLLNHLQNFNRCPAVSDRLKVLNTLEPFVKTLCKNLAEKYRDSLLPLSRRNQQRYQLYNAINEEMALGYKCLMNDLYLEPQTDYPLGKEIFVYGKMAVTYLSRRLLSSYACYQEEPLGLWADLHQIYGIMESVGNGDERKADRFRPLREDAVQAYLRIVLLSITNPYHLMHGEAQIIYHYLKKWSADCAIVRFKSEHVDQGDLIVDLDHDVSPQFIFNDKVKKPKHCRMVVLDNLLDRIHEAARELATGESRSYNERRRRNMLQRLQNAWDERLIRGMQRDDCDASVRLVAGLSACHYYIDNKKVFIPETDEMELYKPSQVDSTSGLSLLPEEKQPWRSRERQHWAEIEAEEKRLSPFEQSVDVWDKIYGQQPLQEQIRQQESTRYKDHVWQQRNQSRRGIGLRCGLDNTSSVAVGNLVCYHPDESQETWQVGVVVWIKQNHKFLDMGVRCMPGRPRSVALRAVSVNGKTTEYFRGLLMEQEGQIQKIITPSDLYDEGKQLVLNHRHNLQYIKLNELTHSTDSFSVFTYEEIAIPASEQQHIQKILSA